MSGVGVAKVAQILDLCNFIPQMELKGHRIMIRDVNRPALQLSGYFEHFEQSRVQIIGTVEYTYLQQLDEKERTIVICKYFEDMTLDEIADTEKENVNTVKSRLYRALKKLRVYLEEPAGSGSSRTGKRGSFK